jgi:NitT/TauT family transport system ATP-binding protein
VSDRHVLETQSVSHVFETSSRRIPVLDDISLRVSRGEFVALVGASGSGKTTLLRTLAGLLRPSSGRVLVDGGDVTGTPSTERGVVFQSDRLFPWMTALENAAVGLEFRGEPQRVRTERGLEALRIVGLAEFASAYPSQLSGGMRQRVNIARAMVTDPAFLLMDEPFASLDAQTREFMQAELLRILGTTSVGVVFVTHQIEEALFLADRVVVLGANPGRIRDEIAIDFARPRELALKRAHDFQELYQRVWSQIEADVRASMRIGPASAPPQGQRLPDVTANVR